MKPLAIDLFCGLGGWTEGLLAEGWDVIGFDIERHVYGEHRYPVQLVLQDVLTLHGSQFRSADLIVASPPCQEYSYMAMPWTRAKAKAAAIRADTTGKMLADLNWLFDACFRIQAQASLAAGRHIPMVVENVRGAQPWVERARWNYGSFYLWGDVPALMPPISRRATLKGGDIGWTGFADTGASWRNREAAIRNAGGSWFNVAHNTESGKGQNPDGRKGVGPKYDPATGNGAHGMTRWTNPAEGVKQRGSGAAWFDKALDERRRDTSPMRQHHSGSTSRKFASAMIAKIPLPLSRHVARVCKP